MFVINVLYDYYTSNGVYHSVWNLNKFEFILKDGDVLYQGIFQKIHSNDPIQ